MVPEIRAKQKKEQNMTKDVFGRQFGSADTVVNGVRFKPSLSSSQFES